MTHPQEISFTTTHAFTMCEIILRLICVRGYCLSHIKEKLNVNIKKRACLKGSNYF